MGALGCSVLYLCTDLERTVLVKFRVYGLSVSGLFMVHHTRFSGFRVLGHFGLSELRVLLGAIQHFRVVSLFLWILVGYNFTFWL